eukprot:evm.model.scf_1775.4 EVM.evm.TU.scf_1775.4   scf_1775:24224-27288(+)
MGRLLKTHSTEWTPSDAKVSLNVALESCFLPTADGGHRVSWGHVVVLDNFIPDAVREKLLGLITMPGWDHTKGPPLEKWERETCDQAGLPRSWGLKDELLNHLADTNDVAVLEVQSRICKLYPEFKIVHMPSNEIQAQNNIPAAICECPALPGSGAATGDTAAAAGKEQQEGDQSKRAHVDCNAFVGNAAVYGDCYQWHVDADPSTFPPSPWVDRHGRYFNGEPGKPLLVSLLLYLNPQWPLHWDAETLFLDSPTTTGVFVRPKPCRAVLMDQDIWHRVSTPSQLAKRPRYSLVWKLAYLPTVPGQHMCIARKEWGPPSYFGSCARVKHLADIIRKGAEGKLEDGSGRS